MTEPLADGAAGNVQALRIAAKIVEQDRQQPDLRAFVLREIVKDVAGHDFAGERTACFEFARDRIIYRRDPPGVERIADMWSTLYALNPKEPEGDCLIKCVFLATCLSLLGEKPFFIVIRQNEKSNSFNHVYLGVTEKDGSITPLDPTPPDRQPGEESGAINKAMFPIF